MYAFPQYPDVATLRRRRGFADVLSRLVGVDLTTRDDATFEKALLEAAGLGLEHPCDGHYGAVSLGNLSFPEAAVSTALAVAAHWAGERENPVEVGPRVAPVPADPASQRPDAWRGVSHVRRKYAPRSLDLGDGRWALVQPMPRGRAGDVAILLRSPGRAHDSVESLRLSLPEEEWSAFECAALRPHSAGELARRASKTDAHPLLRTGEAANEAVVDALGGAFGGKQPRWFHVETAVACRRFFAPRGDRLMATLAGAHDFFAASNIAGLQRLHAFLAGAGAVERLAQAFDAYPILFCFARFQAGHAGPWPLHERLASGKFVRASEGLVERIAAGESTSRLVRETLSAALGRDVRPNVARSFSGYVGEQNANTLDRLVGLVDGILGPLGRSLEWGEVLALWENSRLLPGLGEGAGPREAVALAMASRDAEGRHRVFEEGLRDFLKWCAEAVDRSGLPPAWRPAAAAGIAFPPKARIARVVEASNRWHRDASALSGKLQEARLAVAVRANPAINPSAFYPEVRGLAVSGAAQLRSSKALEEEGLEMRHCVGSYAVEALAGECFVFSIRDAHGRSTAAIDYVPGEDPFARVQQVRGPANAPPPEAHLEAAEALRQAVLLDRTLSSRANEAARNRDLVEASLADNRTLGPLADASFETLRPYLPKGERRMSREAWVALKTNGGARDRRREA